MNERDTGAPNDASVEIIESAESIEQKRARVDEWITNISKNQEVKVVLGEKIEAGEMDSNTLREVLESYGAHFENLNGEGRESLRGYSEHERGKGVRQVWGNENVNNYKEWAKGFLADYELKTGVKWPILKDKEHPEESSNRKASGMNQFLFELTSFAAAETTPSAFKEYMEARVRNGVAWVEGRKSDRKPVDLPAGKGSKLLSSIPKEFPIAAMDWIKTKASESLPQQ